MFFYLLGQGQKELSSSHKMRSLAGVGSLLFGLSLINFLICDQIFSRLTLQETESIDTFDELKSRKDISIFDFEDRHKKKLYSNNTFKNNLPQYMIQPNHVFLAIFYNAQIYIQSYSGLPIKIASEKLDFALLAKYPIRYQESKSKQWIQELKNCLKSFYENGFFLYAYNLKLACYCLQALPVMRELYRTGRIDDNDVKPLTLAQFKQSFITLIISSFMTFLLIVLELYSFCLCACILPKINKIIMA